MSTASAPRSWAWLAVVVCATALAIGCNSDSPTGPTLDGPPVVNNPPPAPSPSPGPTPTGAVTIAINPDPVPHSGQPITDAAGCANVRYTWFYDQVFQETGGSQVTFTNRIDLFDERETNNVSANVVVPANGSLTIRSRWCSSDRREHSAQTRWTGTDAAGRAIVVLGAKARLMAP